METWQRASEIVELQNEKDQPPKETLEKSRDGARGVDEGSAGEEDNRPVEAAGLRQREGRLGQWPLGGIPQDGWAPEPEPKPMTMEMPIAVPPPMPPPPPPPPPPKETLGKSRDGARGVDEGSAGVEDNRPVEAAGLRQRKGRLGQWPLGGIPQDGWAPEPEPKPMTMAMPIAVPPPPPSPPPKETLEKSRDGARGVDEGSAGVEDNRPVEAAGLRQREGSLGQWPLGGIPQDGWAPEPEPEPEPMTMEMPIAVPPPPPPPPKETLEKSRDRARGVDEQVSTLSIEDSDFTLRSGFFPGEYTEQVDQQPAAERLQSPQTSETTINVSPVRVRCNEDSRITSFAVELVEKFGYEHSDCVRFTSDVRPSLLPASAASDVSPSSLPPSPPPTPPSIRTFSNVSDESTDISEETEEAQKLAKEIKNILQFAYFSTGMVGAAIFGFLSGFMSNQKGQTDSIHVKICIVLIIATIVSGVSMILIALLHPRNRVSFKIIKDLKYATLGLLTMATFGASILLFS